MFLGICLAQERRSQRHFRSSFGGQELRACVGLKEADCCTPLLFLGCDHDSHVLDRWQEVVSDLWPGLWVGVMKVSETYYGLPFLKLNQLGIRIEEKVVCSDHSSTELLLNFSSDD